MTPDANSLVRTHGLEALRLAADAAHHFSPNAANPTAISATPYPWHEPEDIPVRPWVYGRLLIRQAVSVTVAPGGVGKTSLLVAEALAMASGRSFLDETLPAGALRVWLLNLEESEDEMIRRVQATALHHDIRPDDIAGRLFISVDPGNPLLTASADHPGQINEAAFEMLEHEIRQKRIDVVIVDPFVSTHALDENANGPVDRLVKRWGGLADRTRCAVHIVHHTRKGDGTIGSESARGAKALVDAARMVRALNPATADDLDLLGLQPDVRAFSARRDKQNMAAGHDDRTWYIVRAVSLGNGPPADEVGVVATISTVKSGEGRLSASVIDAVRSRLAEKDHGFHPNSGDWAGLAIAPILQLNPEDATGRRRLRHAIGAMVQAGHLDCVDVRDSRAGRYRKVVRVSSTSLPPQFEDDGVDACGGVDA